MNSTKTKLAANQTKRGRATKKKAGRGTQRKMEQRKKAELARTKEK